MVRNPNSWSPRRGRAWARGSAGRWHRRARETSTGLSPARVPDRARRATGPGTARPARRVATGLYVPNRRRRRSRPRSVNIDPDQSKGWIRRLLPVLKPAPQRDDRHVRGVDRDARHAAAIPQVVRAATDNALIARDTGARRPTSGRWSSSASGSSCSATSSASACSAPPSSSSRACARCCSRT